MTKNTFLGLMLLLPAAVHASTLYSLTGTYAPYDVTIAFTTSLTGPALDNLSSADITSTVSGFSESNTITSGTGTNLDVIISTNPTGNITAFDITDTNDQVVTNTSDTGPPPVQAPLFDNIGVPDLATSIQNGELDATYIGPCFYNDSTGALILDLDLGDCPAKALPPLPAFSAPSLDEFGLPLTLSSVQSGDLLADYLVGTCTFSESTGALIRDIDVGACPAKAISNQVIASGSGTFTSIPADPGTAAPEPSAVLLTAGGLVALAGVRKKMRLRV